MDFRSITNIVDINYQVLHPQKMGVQSTAELPRTAPGGLEAKPKDFGQRGWGTLKKSTNDIS